MPGGHREEKPGLTTQRAPDTSFNFSSPDTPLEEQTPTPMTVENSTQADGRAVINAPINCPSDESYFSPISAKMIVTSTYPGKLLIYHNL
uniref:Uncharacterized protein n=1 Tax=Timema bartmani TaxID=61472 RepID=A0A7R9F350_9NEOP|nr:unnamed protein product [Timema bartmani]